MAAARKRAGLTQQELSDLSGVPRTTIGRLECRQRQGQISTVEILADALGISIDEYIGHEVKSNG